MKNHRIYIFLIYFLLSAQSFVGQIIPRDSSNFSQSVYQQNSLNNLFNKQLNTYILNTDLIFSSRSNNLFWGIKENYSSTINITSFNNVKDEQYFSFITDYRISQLLQPGILIKHSIYSDDRKIDINQASNLNAILYTKIYPINKIQITPYFGYSDNQQVSENNQGLIYGIEGNVNRLKISDINLFSNAKFENEDISPRKNQLRFINFNLENEFDEGLKNNISVYYTSLRRDFYFEPDTVTAAFFKINNNIQTRTESNYYLQERIFYYAPQSNIGFDISGKVSWRDIDKSTRYIYVNNAAPSTFDSKINEFRLDFNASLEYRNDFMSSNIRLVYSEQEEKHIAKRINGVSNIFYDERNDLEKQLNNKAKQSTITITNNFSISEKDELSISLFHRKLVYDTPSEKNFDDRDELLTMLRVYYLRSISPFFDFFVNLEGNFNKIVYLFAERSSNNNVKRVIKLASGGYYSGKYFASSNSVEVSANYVVYDFEDLNPTYQSYAFRQFQYRDSTGINLDKNISCVVNGYIKLSEQGDFNWADFSGKPQRFLKEIFTEPKIFYKIKNAKFGIGLRYFELSTYTYTSATNKKLETKYRSIAPLSEITYIIVPKLNIKVNCWYEYIRNEKNNMRTQTYMNIDLQWKF
ncbi:MAG: hypothetical protein V1773_18075 [bacterium]